MLLSKNLGLLNDTYDSPVVNCSGTDALMNVLGTLCQLLILLEDD